MANNPTPCITATDFFWYLIAALLGSFLMFLIPALKIRARKKPVTIDAIGEELGKTRDDPNEPARFVP